MVSDSVTQKAFPMRKLRSVELPMKENSSLSTLLDYLKFFCFSLFPNLNLSLYLSLLPLIACTYLNNALDLVLLALPLYVCLFKINRFIQIQIQIVYYHCTYNEIIYMPTYPASINHNFPPC